MNRTLLILILLAVQVTAVVLVARWIAHRRPLRTVELSMRDYMFNGNNPTLTFRPRDRVRFIVRNDETTTIRHNFAIVGLDVPCDRELGPGETREVAVTMPSSGEFEYVCCTHRGMGGKLVIVDR